MSPLYIIGAGVSAPGLADWRQAADVLGGQVVLADDGSGFKPKAPPILSPNERRRLSPTITLALQVAWEAVQHAGLPADRLAAVFACGDGDGGIVHRLCEALATPVPQVSPTVFHNSVHNAPAGYWAIGTGCEIPAVSLAALDESAAAGLLEAAVQVTATGEPVLLVVYDLPPPPPLAAKRPVLAPFGAALVLSPQPSATALSRLQLALIGDDAPTVMDDPALEHMRLGNPAARLLPLLEAMACRRPARLVLPAPLGRALAITVSPCG